MKELLIFPDRPNAPMVFVQGGTFTMGCQKGKRKYCYEDEKLAHTVQLSDFYMDQTQVTNEQYATFLNAYGGD